jgi:hypothetical protein
MMTLAALRQRGSTARVAVILWIVWAVVVWNVVFDRMIVVAGRRYVHAAAVAARGNSGYARMDDWMRPAVTRAFWTASAAAAILLLVLLVALLWVRARR